MCPVGIRLCMKFGEQSSIMYVSQYLSVCVNRGVRYQETRGKEKEGEKDAKQWKDDKIKRNPSTYNLFGGAHKRGIKYLTAVHTLRTICIHNIYH